MEITFQISASDAMGGAKGAKGPEYRSSREKNRRVKCRVCSSKDCAAQNYARHLRERHKEVWESEPGNLHTRIEEAPYGTLMKYVGLGT